jgi:outer membrane protein assembly factor BamB
MSLLRCFSLLFCGGCISLLADILPTAHAQPALEAKPAKPGLWTLDKGLAQPESAYFEPTTQTIYVSNVQGNPTDKDGKGYISKLSPDGKMLAEKWVEGLNAPKGLRSFNKTLFVADIDTLVAIDLTTGKVLKRIEIPGAQLLNDIGVDSDGKIYISDTFGSKVYVVEDGKSSVWLNETQVTHPNGLLVHDQELVVASWGEGMDTKTWGTKQPGKLVAYDLKSKEKTEITKQPLGNLDGLENDGSGGYYVSDHVAGIVYHISADGAADAILGGFKGAADLGLIDGKSVLLLPRMGEDKLTAYDLEQL